ncbi:MAG TPA: hypothetical protein VF493_17060 [Terriglobales bacterium]
MVREQLIDLAFKISQSPQSLCKKEFGATQTIVQLGAILFDGKSMGALLDPMTIVEAAVMRATRNGDLHADEH